MRRIREERVGLLYELFANKHWGIWNGLDQEQDNTWPMDTYFQVNAQLKDKIEKVF